MRKDRVVQQLALRLCKQRQSHVIENTEEGSSGTPQIISGLISNQIEDRVGVRDGRCE